MHCIHLKQLKLNLISFPCFYRLMPELPKFDDEDLKSYGDEEEELALCVFFPHFFLMVVFQYF